MTHAQLTMIACLRIEEFRVRYESYLSGHCTATGLAEMLRELYSKTESIVTERKNQSAREVAS